MTTDQLQSATGIDSPAPLASGTDPELSATRRLLCIAYDFPPDTSPTAIRTGKLVEQLVRHGWAVDVLTAIPTAALPGVPGVTVRTVPQPATPALGRWIRRTRLHTVSELIEWPDALAGWAQPAIEAAMAIVGERRPDAVAVFMMPYSAGRIGLALKRLTGLPLLLNFDDSPTCSDMTHSYANRWQYRRTAAYEDRLVQAADATVYVSKRNLDRVGDRQPADVRGKLHLVRYGADPADFADPVPAPPAKPGDPFRIVYTGGMNGWHAFGSPNPRGPRASARRAHAWLNRVGRYTAAPIDYRGSTPVFIGRAVRQLIDRRPDLAGRIRVDVHGVKFPPDAVRRLLDQERLNDIVTVSGSIPNRQAIALARRADLLLMTLPDRIDGSPGGRISAKTYEYLMTDRPILAALPPGEGPDFLAGYPGVTVVRPTDVPAMAAAVEDAVDHPGRRYARPTADLDYRGRGDAFAAVLNAILSPSATRGQERP